MGLTLQRVIVRDKKFYTETRGPRDRIKLTGKAEAAYRVFKRNSLPVRVLLIPDVEQVTDDDKLSEINGVRLDVGHVAHNLLERVQQELRKIGLGITIKEHTPTSLDINFHPL